jgi:hypothetical protein
MDAGWILVLIGIVISIIAIAFAFWFIPMRGTGRWLKFLDWDERNAKRYD